MMKQVENGESLVEKAMRIPNVRNRSINDPSDSEAELVLAVLDYKVSTRQMAAVLGISQGGVNSRIGSILRKAHSQKMIEIKRV
jgi:hypothetical protein